MLNEKSIDKLITPLIDRQNQIEMTVLEKIAKRLGEIKTMLPSDVHKLEILLKNGSDVREINKQIAKLTKLQEKEIKKIIKTVAKDAYEDAKPYYDYRKKPFIPYEENEILQNAIKAMERATLADYDNLSNATAFMMRDPAKGNFFFPTSLSKSYQKIIDMAIQSVVMGPESYNAVIPKAIKELVKSGIKTVEYTSDKGKKHYVRLDTVVKRNILDGIRNINHEVDRITGEQFGSDGVELSVHNYSAPDHEPIQGHRFTNEEFDKLQTNQPFEDEKGIKFAPIERPIGVWNCHHIIISVILDAMSPTYTQQQLDEIIKKNANGYTYINKKGEKVTKSKYWCTQKMHYYELDIKKAKEGKKAAELAKEPEIEAQYRAEITKKQNEYIQFCKDCGLKPRFENTRIYSVDDKIKSPVVGVDNSVKSGIIKVTGKGVDMRIDKFTPCLEDAKNGVIVPTSFSIATQDELKNLKDWNFDWTDSSLKQADIYKLTIKDKSEIQGLIALTKFERDRAVYVNIVESAPHNLGENKQYNGVGGHLYAIAAQKSVDNGYGGFIFMDAKNIELVEHYQKTLGATLLGHPHEYRMFIDEVNAQKLLKIYNLEEE